MVVQYLGEYVNIGSLVPLGQLKEIKTSLLRAAEDPTLGLRAAALSALRHSSWQFEVEGERFRI